MKIIALDPGGTTGAVVFTIDQILHGFIKEHFRNLHIGNNEEHHKALWTFLVREHPDKIICETFDNRGNEFAKIMSREYIGVVKLYSALFGVPVVWQTPSKKEWAKDEILMAMTLLRLPTSKWKHTNDAMRHMVYWIVFAPNDLQTLRLLLLEMTRTES